MHDDADQHSSVLRPAILRAVAQICSRRHRVYPHAVVAVWNDVCLSGKLWDPEAVRDISRFQLQKSWLRLSRVTNRNMELVSGDDAEVGITDLPPPLMTDDCCLDGSSRWSRVLDFDNRTSRHQGQHKNNQDRYDCPSELYLIAAVDLGRFVRVIATATPESCDRINKQSDNYDKNHRADSKHEYRVVKDCPGRRTIRFENVGHAAPVISKDWNSR